MPHISVKLYPGRSEEELKKISKILENALLENTSWEEIDISVSIDEIEANKFEEVVVKKTQGELVTIESDVIKY